MSSPQMGKHDEGATTVATSRTTTTTTRRRRSSLNTLAPKPLALLSNLSDRINNGNSCEVQVDDDNSQHSSSGFVTHSMPAFRTSEPSFSQQDLVGPFGSVSVSPLWASPSSIHSSSHKRSSPLGRFQKHKSRSAMSMPKLRGQHEASSDTSLSPVPMRRSMTPTDLTTKKTSLPVLPNPKGRSLRRASTYSEIDGQSKTVQTSVPIRRTNSSSDQQPQKTETPLPEAPVIPKRRTPRRSRSSGSILRRAKRSFSPKREERAASRPVRRPSPDPNADIPDLEPRIDDHDSSRDPSPFRRTRSAETGSKLRRSTSALIDSDDEKDDHDNDGHGDESQGDVGDMCQDPPRRTVSGGVLSQLSSVSRVKKGTMSIPDLAPRIPLPSLARGRSMDSSMLLKGARAKGGATSPNSSEHRRAPPSRSASSMTSIKRPGASSGALGRSVRVTKSACSDLVEMQKALGRSALSVGGSAVKGGLSVGASAGKKLGRGTVSVTRQSIVVVGGSALRATKSACADIAEMHRALGIVSSRTTERAEAQPDPLFSEMMTWNPNDAEDREKYSDDTVRRQIRRNPDAIRAKYQITVGRSTVSRSALSTIIALGASLETVRVAIKAHPDSLRVSGDAFSRSTPLHTACSFNTDMAVVKYLYNKYPYAIQETTKHVFLPLHNACQMSTPSMEMIRFLVEAYPEALMAINKLGDNPLRTAVRNENMPQEILDYLDEETERAFSQNDETQHKRREIAERQSWGSRELPILDLSETDHTTTTTANMDISDSDELAS